MKNLRFCTLFLCLLAVVCCSLLTPALAEDGKGTPKLLVMKSGNSTGSTIANARDIVFGTEYAVSWSPDTAHLNCYNKLVVPADGVLSISAVKPLDDYDKLGALEFYLYDNSGNTVWGNETYRAKSDGLDSYSLHVGVAKGVYYLTLKPGFTVRTGTIDTRYTIGFTKDAYAEREQNESASTATEMIPGHFYSAWYGQDGAFNTEEAECFRFTTTKGNRYSLKLSDYAALKSSSAMFKLLTPDGKVGSVDSQLKNTGALSFQANSTGVFVLQIDNYSGKQIPYKVGVFVNDDSYGTHFSVLYNANGGSSTPDMQLKQAGRVLTLSSGIPTRDGYTFIGWARSPAAEPEFQPGELYTEDSDITLYAIWMEETASGSVVVGTTMGTTMSNAVNVSFGTAYRKMWTSSTDHLNCYSKITLPQDGVITINATKPSDNDEYGSMEIYLYDKAGNLAWGNGTHSAKSDGRDAYRLKVGLAKGSYFLTIKPGFTVKTGTITTDYSVFFTPNAHAEMEQNETAASATRMAKDHFYTGSLGHDGANNTEENDYYSFTVTAGNSYTIRSDCFDQISGTTTMIDLFFPDGTNDSIHSSLGSLIDASGRYYHTFKANSTGTCLLKLYNYSSRQLPYSIGVFTDGSAEQAFYTLSYDPNGGCDAPSPQTKTAGVPMTLSEIEPIQSGHRFMGWALAPDADQAAYLPGASFDIDADTTLYAVWEPIPDGSSVSLGTSGGNTMANAVSIAFGTRYTRLWTPSTDHLNCYNRIVMDRPGVLHITASKPKDSDEYNNLKFYLYNSAGDLLWGNATHCAQDDTRTDYSLNVGLGKGIYYLTVKPGFTVISGTISTTYQLNARYTSACELEPNETAASATAMELNRYYSAYIGEDGASNCESDDYFCFTATAGENYIIRSGNYAQLGATTALIDLLAPSGKRESIGSNLERNIDSHGNSYWRFKATSTGCYGIHIHNYSGRQIGYSIGVFTEETSEEVTYTVRYDANGGTDAPNTQFKTHGSTLTLSSDRPVRAGYSFVGWADSVSMLSPDYMPGDRYTEDANLTLYAIWQRIGGSDSSVNLGTTGHTTVSAALSASFGTSYTRSWTSSTYRYATYHMLSVSENGILMINATKPYDTDEYGSLEFTLYNQSGSAVVWANETHRAQDDPKDSYRLSVGIPAGTYYLAIKPAFSVTSGTINSTYSFTFAASPYTELEPNDSQNSATHMTLDHMYAASYGKDGASNGEKEDYFSFEVVKGETYQIRSDNFAALSASTAIVTLTDPSGDRESISYSMPQTTDQNGHCYYSYTAEASGTAFIRVYNYIGASINYTLGVFTSGARIPTAITITYDANGGTGGINKQLCYENTTCIITERIPVRDGCLFLGWGLSADAEEVVYRPGDLFTGTEDVRLYALWLNIISDDTPRTALPAGTVAVEAESFCGSGVQYVIVPDGCTSIGSRAFADCRRLKAISLPTGITIAEDAFEGSSCILLYR